MFRSLFSAPADWDPQNFPIPWENGRPSLYDFVKDHIDAEVPGLRGGGETLPDEDIFYADMEDGARWISGGLDGAFGHHAGGGSDRKLLKATYKALCAALDRPNPKNIHRLYAILRRDEFVGIVDSLIEKIVAVGKIDTERLGDLALWLATFAPDRGAVKFGISMLGILRGDADELFQALGRHEEFTLYAAVALDNSETATDHDLWALARNVTGWGRIQVIERLADSHDPEIRKWLVRDGYRNDVMVEYLAYTCAVAGDLLTELNAPKPDDALIKAAGEIIGGLIIGGPAEDMDDYDDGAQVTELYLTRIEDRELSLDEYLTVTMIQDFVTDDEAAWEDRERMGWTQDTRDAITGTADRILGRPDWRDRALRGLEEKDPGRFYVANRVAGKLGIDTWDILFERQRDGVDDQWFDLMQTDDPARVERAVTLAEGTIPLAEIATGPANELGLGPEFTHHSALDFIVQELGRFPGLGWPLIAASLSSPVTRNRYMALRALDAWGRDAWPSGAEEALSHAVAIEPDADIQPHIANLIAGRDLGYGIED